jgi:ABC-type cobalt transport system substrate-binding protein
MFGLRVFQRVPCLVVAKATKQQITERGQSFIILMAAGLFRFQERNKFMKQIRAIVLVVALTFIVFAPTANAWWWSHDDTSKEQIIALEGQLQQQRQSTGEWQIISFVLGITSVVMLVAGAAIGSQGRKNARPTE